MQTVSISVALGSYESFGHLNVILPSQFGRAIFPIRMMQSNQKQKATKETKISNRIELDAENLYLINDDVSHTTKL